MPTRATQVVRVRLPLLLQLGAPNPSGLSADLRLSSSKGRKRIVLKRGDTTK